MLEGQDKYTWVKNRCTDAEYAGAARVLAQFHHAAYDFEAGELAREQPPIMGFVASSKSVQPTAPRWRSRRASSTSTT